MEGAWDSVETIAYDSHLRDNTTEVICEYLESSITGHLPANLHNSGAGGHNITLEDCEDTFHQVVGKAQQLFVFPVSDKTVPNKLKVLFATMAISITAHVKLMKTQFELR